MRATGFEDACWEALISSLIRFAERSSTDSGEHIEVASGEHACRESAELQWLHRVSDSLVCALGLRSEHCKHTRRCASQRLRCAVCRCTAPRDRHYQPDRTVYITKSHSFVAKKRTF